MNDRQKPKHEIPAMGTFEQACKEVDTRFDQVMDTYSDNEPIPVMLLRAAAKMILTTYPEHRMRTLAMNNLLSSAEHLKAVGTAND